MILIILYPLLIACLYLLLTMIQGFEGGIKFSKYPGDDDDDNRAYHKYKFGASLSYPDSEWY